MTGRDGSGAGIERRYRERTTVSRQLMERAAEAMPGGNTRSTSFHLPYPVVFERGEGAWLWGVDSNRYLDLFYNGLSIIHGHGYEPIRRAMIEAAARGTAWSGSSRAQIDYAELLRDRVLPEGLVRFTNSGSEAAMVAVKLARTATGRPLVLKFERAYHGCYPDLEAGLYGQGEIAGRTVLARFNDAASLERALDLHGPRVAAVVYEPVLFTGRVVPPAEGFLSDLQALAKRHGALTILDDCLMLRLAPGGSRERYGLDPDLIVLGKFIGGGTALGAIVGRRDLMALLDPRRPGGLFHGGSFNGNVLGCAAGAVALRDLTAAAIQRMDRQAGDLRRSLAAKARALGIEAEVSGVGSVGGIAFAADPARHEDDPAALGLSTAYHLACLNQGVALGPGGLFALATMVDDQAVAHGTGAMEAALEALARDWT